MPPRRTCMPRAAYGRKWNHEIADEWTFLKLHFIRILLGTSGTADVR